MKRAAFLCGSSDNIERVYGRGRREQLAELVDLYPAVITGADFADHAAILPQLEVVFSTWGMPSLEAGQLEQMPALQAVFYAAGSVKSFAPPLLRHGIILSSGWGANAVPVAEFALAQILLSCKGYFRNTRDCGSSSLRRAGQVFSGPGVFGETIGLIGMGMVGRTLARRLQGYALNVLGYDPYLDAASAGELGVQPVDLEELFTRSLVVSNHLPNIPDTQRLLDARLFTSMRPNATFINTARGAQVDEDALIATLEHRPDLTALLDVTSPEPPESDSGFYALPNVQLSSHIAGSINDEVVRMADYMIDEFKRWEQGEALHYQVSAAMLETMA